ncbi:MAG: efflux RND transporter periplasmic adaptor subunit [Rhizobiaceae bacterium]|nr:efflux RND transporter periplasmic adaptor subunit [Rhizobiaceae bacterium]
MAVWKQCAVALLILVAAAAGWWWLYPGAPTVLARWGMGQAPAGQAAAANGGQQRSGGASPQTPVVTDAVLEATINDRMSAIGSGRALASVTVNPFSAGRLDKFLVTSGTHVEAGQALASLDADAEQIAADRARIALSDAEDRRDRVKSLRTSNTATAVQLNEAELGVENARLALREAQLNLERRSIVAPIAGIVGILPIDAGNYVTQQTSIATIDDRSELLIDFWVPERFASAISVGAPLTATLVSRPDQVVDGTVSAVDNRIDEASRTLLVQARIPNRDDALRAGMSFRIAMQFPGDTFPAVNPLAVQWGSDGAFVWVVRDGKAARLPVRIVQRNTESVLVDAPIRPGETVVVEGIHAVREGQEVLIASQTPTPAAIVPASQSSGGG